MKVEKDRDSTNKSTDFQWLSRAWGSSCTRVRTGFPGVRWNCCLWHNRLTIKLLWWISGIFTLEMILENIQRWAKGNTCTMLWVSILFSSVLDPLTWCIRKWRKGEGIFEEGYAGGFRCTTEECLWCIRNIYQELYFLNFIRVSIALIHSLEDSPDLVIFLVTCLPWRHT